MTDDPMNEIESRQAMTSMAALIHHFHVELVGQGFTEVQALKLTTAYLVEMVASGKRLNEGDAS